MAQEPLPFTSMEVPVGAEGLSEPFTSSKSRRKSSARLSIGGDPSVGMDVSCPPPRASFVFDSPILQAHFQKMRDRDLTFRRGSNISIGADPEPGNVGLSGLEGPDEIISDETAAKIMEITGMDHTKAAPERVSALKANWPRANFLG